MAKITNNNITMSDKGKNFDGEKLDEDNLLSGQTVIWNLHIFYTGNRKNDYVDLHVTKDLGEATFFRCVPMSGIRLVKIWEKFNLTE